MLKFTKDKTEYGLLALHKSSNSEVSHIFINGFMTDEMEYHEAKDWLNGLEDFINFSDKRFIYRWESGLDYSKLENYIPFRNGFKNELKKIKHVTGFSLLSSKVNPLIVTSKLNPFLILPIGISSYYLEEWKTSKVNSIKYGISLAKEIDIQNIKDDKIYLYAHSLGVNLLKNTLLELSKQNITVEKVFLFGGASCINNEDEWIKVCNSVNEGIYNFYTSNDSVLKYFYKIAELGSTPVGLSPINLESNKLFNIDVSDSVSGHLEYKKNLNKILNKYI